MGTDGMDRRVVVVGSGIVGSSIAYELQKGGADTILVERDIEPQGASAFSFASVSALDEPLREVYLLKSLGLVRWHQWATELGEEINFHGDGEIRWAEDQAGADLLRAKFDRAVSRGYPAHSISKSKLRELLPASSPHDVLTAVQTPDDGQADPIATIDALRTAFIDHGGTLLVGRASLLFQEKGIEVRVGEDQIDASDVVVAAGAETASLLERFGYEIPMNPSPGLLVLTVPTVPIVRGTVYVSQRTGPPIHLRQLKDGRVLIGERAQDEVAKDPTMDHARKLLRQARGVFPVLEGVEIDRFTVEWRPMPSDGKPIIGSLPGLKNLYVAAGHSGVTIAPAVGRLLAREVIDQKPAAQLAPFSPARFAQYQADVRRSVEEAFDGAPELFIG